jgi:hypothetical protein
VERGLGELCSCRGCGAPTMIQEIGFALDSPLEEAGFEPSVPLAEAGGLCRTGGSKIDVCSTGGPRVRIRFPPAESPRTIGSAGDFSLPPNSGCPGPNFLGVYFQHPASPPPDRPHSAQHRPTPVRALRRWASIPCLCVGPNELFPMING